MGYFLKWQCIHNLSDLLYVAFVNIFGVLLDRNKTFLELSSSPCSGPFKAFDKQNRFIQN